MTGTPSPFADARTLDDGPVPSPGGDAGGDASGDVTRTIGGNPLVSIPLAVLNRTAQTVKGVADSAKEVAPGIFQRADEFRRGPFADAVQLDTGQPGSVSHPTDAGEAGWAGGVFPGISPLEKAPKGQPPAFSALSQADNIRTGLQRGGAADAAVGPAIVDLAHRGLFYAAQTAYNLAPPMRVDVGEKLWNHLAPWRIFQKPDDVPWHHVVNLGGSNVGMRGFGGGGSGRYDPAFGRPPDPWTESYTEASQRKTPSGAPGFWASPLRGSGLPGETITFGDGSGAQPGFDAARQSAEGIETARGLPVEQGPPQDSGSSGPVSFTIPKTKLLPDLDPVSITKGVDDAVTGIGTGFNSLSDYLAHQRGQKVGGHIDLTPHVPSNRFEQYVQEMAAGIPAPGKLLTRMAVANASARVGQIPGIEGTSYELPARMVASILTGIPFAYRRGLPGETGRVVRQNVEDLGEYSPPGTKPGWPEWLHRGSIIPPARPIPGTGQAALERLEGQQQQLNAMGLSVMPAELAQAGRGDVPSVVALTHRVAKTKEGEVPIRAVLAKRPEQMNTVIGDHIDEVAGPRPADQAAVAGKLAAAAKGEGNAQAGAPADFADTTGEFTGNAPARQPGPPGIYGPADPASAPVFGIEAPVTPPAAAPATPTTPAVPPAPPGRTATTRLADVADAPALPGSTAVSTMDRARALLLDPAKSSPAAIAETAQALNAQDPAAWRELVSEWLHRERARAFGRGTDPEMGAKFAARVFGDPDKKSILRASLENIVGPDGNPLPAATVEKFMSMMGGVENTDTLSRAVAKGVADTVPKKPPGMIGAFFGGVANKIPGVNEAVSSFRTGSQARVNANLGNILSSPTGISQMLDLAWRIPRRERQKAVVATLLNDTRNLSRSIMFGNGGGLPRSPLLDPDLPGGGGDQPKPPGPLRIEIRPRP